MHTLAHPATEKLIARKFLLLSLICLLAARGLGTVFACAAAVVRILPCFRCPSGAVVGAVDAGRRAAGLFRVLPLSDGGEDIVARQRFVFMQTPVAGHV